MWVRAPIRLAPSPQLPSSPLPMTPVGSPPPSAAWIHRGSVLIRISLFIFSSVLLCMCNIIVYPDVFTTEFAWVLLVARIILSVGGVFTRSTDDISPIFYTAMFLCFQFTWTASAVIAWLDSVSTVYGVVGLVASGVGLGAVAFYAAILALYRQQYGTKMGIWGRPLLWLVSVPIYDYSFTPAEKAAPLLISV
ncbi:hypothetical protein K438DRAFT_2014140 [Mycena galopus ATCC 62051]|nr:hypothetical protein K438DRAFT_2014140 [Mycena galopus ATCC 62051]